MAEPASQLNGAHPLRRCCPEHRDWATLSQHLLEEFAELHISDIVRELRRAKDAVAAAALDPGDELATGELIARHQLLLLAGRVSDIARLDPETHVRGRGGDYEAAVRQPA